jgi:hypothetical protein
VSAPISVKYGVAALLSIAVVTAVLWPFLDQPSRRGVLAAGLIALPVQVLAFTTLVRRHGQANGFMAAWAGGMALRAIVVVITAVVVVQTRAAGAVALLLSLAGFFFALLMLEAAFFRKGVRKGVAR